MTREKFLKHSPRQIQALNLMNKRYEQNILAETILTIFGEKEDAEQPETVNKIRVKSFSEMLKRAGR